MVCIKGAVADEKPVALFGRQWRAILRPRLVERLEDIVRFHPLGPGFIGIEPPDQRRAVIARLRVILAIGHGEELAEQHMRDVERFFTETGETVAVARLGDLEDRTLGRDILADGAFEGVHLHLGP